MNQEHKLDGKCSIRHANGISARFIEYEPSIRQAYYRFCYRNLIACYFV
jgi:hypothetical protein